MLLAAGVPSFPFVWPSNWSKFSGILIFNTAVKPSLASDPSKLESFSFNRPYL